MAICDAKYCFTFVTIGDYGRDNDAAIFGKFDVCRAFQSGELSVPAPLSVNIDQHSITLQHNS